MTNSDILLQYIMQHPGLDDDQLSHRTGITPRQTVNQICRRLELKGKLRRDVGASGKIVNFPRSDKELPSNFVPAPKQNTVTYRPARYEPKIEFAENVSYQISDHVAPERILLIIPCSGAKNSGGSTETDLAVTNFLTETSAAKLIEARQRLIPEINLDTQSLTPAWRRYSGNLYQHGQHGLEISMTAGFHALILSGGYGLLHLQESIGNYEKQFRLRDWPKGLLEESILQYIQSANIQSVRIIASTSTDYAKLIRRVPWARTNLVDAWLLSPEETTGAMVKGPRAQGEALTALMLGTLDNQWRSSDGMAIRAERLK